MARNRPEKRVTIDDRLKHVYYGKLPLDSSSESDLYSSSSSSGTEAGRQYLPPLNASKYRDRHHEEIDSKYQDLINVEHAASFRMGDTVINEDTIVTVRKTRNMVYEVKNVTVTGSKNCPTRSGDMTVDMHKITQNLKRSDDPDIHLLKRASQDFKRRLVRTNLGRVIPYQYLLYMPTCEDLLVFISSCLDSLIGNGCVLLYISGPGERKKKEVNVSNFQGGVKKEEDRSANNQHNCRIPDSEALPMQAVDPRSDLKPVTSGPLFIIVESDNSDAFKCVKKLYGPSRIVIMAPKKLPENLSENDSHGSLLTKFLQSPLTAFCYVCEIQNLHRSQWLKANEIIKIFMKEAARVTHISQKIDEDYIEFVKDENLQVYILRYIFCEITLRNHVQFTDKSCRPKAVPSLSSDIVEHSNLRNIFYTLVCSIEACSYFNPKERPSCMERLRNRILPTPPRVPHKVVTDYRNEPPETPEINSHFITSTSAPKCNTIKTGGASNHESDFDRTASLFQRQSNSSQPISGKIYNAKRQIPEIHNGGIRNGGIRGAEIQEDKIETHHSGIRNGGIRNGGIHNGGIRNGDIRNGSIRNGGIRGVEMQDDKIQIYNGGIRNVGIRGAVMQDDKLETHKGGILNGGIRGTEMQDDKIDFYNIGIRNGGIQNGGIRNGGVRGAEIQHHKIEAHKSDIRKGGIRGTAIQDNKIEFYNSDIRNGCIQNGGIRNGGVQNGGIRNGGVQNGGIRNGGVQNGGIRNGGIRGPEMQDDKIEMYNGGIQNGGIQDRELQDDKTEFYNNGIRNGAEIQGRKIESHNIGIRNGGIRKSYKRHEYIRCGGTRGAGMQEYKIETNNSGIRKGYVRYRCDRNGGVRGADMQDDIIEIYEECEPKPRCFENLTIEQDDIDEMPSYRSRRARQSARRSTRAKIE